MIEEGYQVGKEQKNTTKYAGADDAIHIWGSGKRPMVRAGAMLCTASPQLPLLLNGGSFGGA